MTFLAQYFWPIVAAFGALGTIGIVVAVVLFGVPLLVILAQAIGLVRAAFTFLATPVGMAIGVVLLCVLCFFVGDLRGRNLEHKAGQAQIEALKAEAKAAADAADAEARAELEGKYGPELTAIERERDELKKQVEDDEHKMANAGNRCVLGDGPLRLRQRK